MLNKTYQSMITINSKSKTKGYRNDKNAKEAAKLGGTRGEPRIEEQLASRDVSVGVLDL